VEVLGKLIDAMRRVVERSLIESSPQQCTGTVFALNAIVFNRKRHLFLRSSAVLS
jgi:hypothetical protein